MRDSHYIAIVNQPQTSKMADFTIVIKIFSSVQRGAGLINISPGYLGYNGVLYSLPRLIIAQFVLSLVNYLSTVSRQVIIICSAKNTPIKGQTEERYKVKHCSKNVHLNPMRNKVQPTCSRHQNQLCLPKSIL